MTNALDTDPDAPGIPISAPLGGEAALAGLNAWRPTGSAAALGLAVEYLAGKPAFAILPFGEWSRVLFNQVAQGRYLFIIDADRRVCGFLGWALTERRFADAWVAGGPAVRVDQGGEGDCVVVNAWSADTGEVNHFILGAMRKLFADRKFVYFKRHYPDGRERPMRLTVPPRLNRRDAAGAGPETAASGDGPDARP